MKKPYETWPEWLVSGIIAAYRSGQTPAEIGATILRSEGVVQSKLVREGVYLSASTKRKQLAEIAQEGF